MLLFSSRKDKEIFLIDILGKLNIEQNERELYTLSLEVLDGKEFNIFFNKIVEQVTNNGEIHTEISRKTISPLSSSII